jgi:hypothetical protein
MSTAMFETFGVLPYDIATSMAGRTDPTISTVLSWCATMCYWVGFLRGWYIMPVFVCTFMYRYATTFKRAFRYSVRFNILWYVAALIIIVIGLAALMALHLFNLKNLVSLCISLTNSYGTILVILGLGNATVELPRQWFKMASPERKLRTLLNRLNLMADRSAEASVDSRECVELCYRCRQTMNPELEAEVLPVFSPRLAKLEEQCHHRVLPSHLYTRKPNPSITELIRKDYSTAPLEDVETVMSWADDCLTAMDEFYYDVNLVTGECEDAMRLFISYKSGAILPKVRSFFMYVVWIILIVANLMICWGELTLALQWEEWGPFYFLGHLGMSTFVQMIFILTPIITYLVFLGGWAMTWVHAGKQFYRLDRKSTRLNSSHS